MSRKKNGHRRGFGLLESLLALFLFAIILVVVADLVNGFRNLVRHSQGRSRTLKSSQIALSQLRSDIRAAVEIMTPADGDLSSTLTLKRLTPGLSPRLPATVPSVPAKSWDILDPTYIYEIAYRVDDNRLIRKVGAAELVMATGLSDFSVRADGPQYEITLAIEERARDFTLISRVSRP